MVAWMMTGLLTLLFSPLLLAVEITPTIKVQNTIKLQDDLELENIIEAIDHQLASFKRFKLKGQIRFGEDTYDKSIIKQSLELLKKQVLVAQECFQHQDKKHCLDLFYQELQQSFSFYRPKDHQNQAQPSRFTSYYSPDFNASLVKTERFQRPIYRKPSHPQDLKQTRTQIDYHGALAGKGLELLWVEESAFDIYLLHIQGGGRVKIWDKEGQYQTKYLSYAGKNSHGCQMIYRYMIKQGYLSAKNPGIPAQRSYLASHPEKAEEIFSACPSYIYFDLTDHPPVGLNDVPLTDGRSLAFDRTIYKTIGLITFVKTVKATHVDDNGHIRKVPFSRLFIAQDTGGAIKGNARCDLYQGHGSLAELIAYSMNDPGEHYFLIKKSSP